MGGFASKEAEGVEGVVGGPFALEGDEGAVPDEAVGVLLANGQELTLEIGLRDFEGRLEVDVRRCNRVLHYVNVPVSALPQDPELSHPVIKKLYTQPFGRQLSLYRLLIRQRIQSQRVQERVPPSGKTHYQRAPHRRSRF